MRSFIQHTILCSPLILVTAFSSAAAFATEGERSISLQEDVSQAELIRLNVPAGDVDITGTTGKSLTAVVTAVCQQDHQENCYHVLKELGWSKKTGSITELGLTPSGITRYDHLTIKVKLIVPTDKNLEVSLSAGELSIEGTSACLTANVNAGDIKINLKENELASAELNSKVGDVKFITAKGNTIEGERSLLVGAHLEWNKGAGSCHTKASVLAGEVQLMINP
jgi:hypothetical protein